ncbi:MULTISPECIES: YlxR family protein [unclassified Gordonia (in: high G+C Gram-positive bacteria)]|uniref:YlxR family protein n=1 Tax=unclassified Gordonia (in: high G+C Gram-positive bacteria) TaxID=2657482 RepID=UPI001F10B39B|nr:YlxR family protein [Gordonia sp. ABSL49_1]MCH5642424.1 YlxR family protein [Gordonia sp. ABSL49_1]
MVQRKSSVPSNGGRRDRSARRRPVRTCIGCRQRAEASELARVVVAVRDGSPVIVVDRAKTMPGRGAWLHPRADCLSAAMRRRAFAPALRVRGLAVDPADLTEQLGAVIDTQGSPEPEQVAEDMSTP